MIFGAVNATRQFDMKAILAYSTISQLGMIVAMVGLGGRFAQHPTGAYLRHTDLSYLQHYSIL